MSTRAGYLELFRDNADFRNLWYGHVVSLFGDWFNLIASASLVASLTGSPLAVGGLFVVRMLAPFLVSPIAGVAADRYDKRRLLIATDLVRFVVVLGFLLVREPSHVFFLYALTFVQLAMHGVFFPTRNAMLPEIVSARELGTSNAITAATWSVMLAAGAAAGGFVSGSFGVYPAFVIDSLTFLISAVFIARVRPREAPPVERPHPSARKALAEYLDGLSYLRRNRDVLAIVLNKAALTLFVAGAYEVTQVALAKDVYTLGERGGISLGLFYAALGVGSGLGPLVVRALTGDADRPMRIGIGLSYLAMGAGLLFLSTLPSFGWALAGAMIRAMGGGTIWVLSTQLLFVAVPHDVRGRVFATEYALLTLAMAASAALGGLALDRVGSRPEELLRTMALLTLIPTALWSFWLLRRSAKSQEL
jgi:MFS family permease